MATSIDSIRCEPRRQSRVCPATAGAPEPERLGLRLGAWFEVVHDHLQRRADASIWSRAKRHLEAVSPAVVIKLGVHSFLALRPPSQNWVGIPTRLDRAIASSRY